MRYEIKATTLYKKWFAGLKDTQIKTRIGIRLNFVSNGHFGDHKTFGEISELRFTIGGGLRIYYTIREKQIVFLLAGGNKSSQQRDMAKARAVLKKIGD